MLKLLEKNRANLEKLGKAAEIDPNPAGKYLPGDFIDNKNLESTKKFFKENSGEFKKFVDDPRGYLSGTLSEDDPNKFNFVAEPTGDQTLDAQVKESGIPPIPDPADRPTKSLITKHNSICSEKSSKDADPKIVKGL